jgi:hypothetical protein
MVLWNMRLMGGVMLHRRLVEYVEMHQYPDDDGRRDGHIAGNKRKQECPEEGNNGVDGVNQCVVDAEGAEPGTENDDT